MPKSTNKEKTILKMNSDMAVPATDMQKKPTSLRCTLTVEIKELDGKSQVTYTLEPDYNLKDQKRQEFTDLGMATKQMGTLITACEKELGGGKKETKKEENKEEGK